MPRLPKPWRRKSAGDAWYTTLKGRQVFVAPAHCTPSQTERAFRELLAAEGKGEPRRGGLSVRDVVSLYVYDRTGRVERGELTAATTDAAARFLGPFAKAYPRLSAASLTPAHVVAWLDSHPGWNVTTRASAIVQVKACFNWAVRAGHLPTSPVRGLERPRPNRRTTIPTHDQVRAALATTNERFADLVRALWWTGCRPNEVYTLTAGKTDPDRGVWQVLNKTRGKTGRKYRTVYLTTEAIELTRKLLARHPGPDGCLFRNRYGKPWTRKTVVQAFGRLQKELGCGGELTAYGLRHLWATDALAAGVPVALVAEHLGHTDWAMVSRVYSHLPERGEALRAAAGKVRPGGNPDAPS